MSTYNVMIAPNNSDTARYTYRNISPDLCLNVYKRLNYRRTFRDPSF